MSLDIIKLLPDTVANQIAAGEVIQRPASVVKELLENSIDAGAQHVDLVVKDAGKTLIMVSDDGCGMSETDARLCFERHATSKIRKADDLFAIRTMGFRGEALASIAAIAQVELRTRRSEDEVGTKVCIEGFNVTEQTPTAMAAGTVFSIKNLFFNVPARRNFLKSNNAEMRHIIEEFIRVALMHSDIAFTLNSDGKEIYHLYGGNLKQRIVGLFGKEYDERLLYVHQESTLLTIDGFTVKPEFSKKTRGEQYMFVNTRFIKHPYLHHAIESAYQKMITSDSVPGYFLNITIDPSEIDINIHPTKTEVNFQNVKNVYAIMHAAVSKAIGMQNLSTVIDFDETNTGIDFGEVCRGDKPVVFPKIDIDESFNPFEQDKPKPFGQRSGFGHQTEMPLKTQGDWRVLYGNSKEETQTPEPAQQSVSKVTSKTMFIQLQQSYIVSTIKSGLMLIDQHLAHTRILYEKFLKRIENHTPASQQELFPLHLTLGQVDASLLRELEPQLESLGFKIENMNPTTFIINGIPSDVKTSDSIELIECVLEEYKDNLHGGVTERNVALARALASQAAIRYNTPLDELEMQNLVDELFACNVSDVAPNGKKTFTIISLDDIKTRFN